MHVGAVKERIAFREHGDCLALIEMVVFVGILLVGLAYAWRKHDLEWS